jgi:hypothetical protein
MSGDFTQWSDKDSVIVCMPWPRFPSPLAVLVQCEVCDTDLSAFPTSRQRVDQDKTFHFACYTCFTLLKSIVDDIPIKGRITNNKFPV